MSLLNKMSQYLGIRELELREFIKIAPVSYKLFYIDKVNGTKRAIYQPSQTTKSLQYALINILFNKLKVHSSAHAYIKNKISPLKQNALIHSKYRFSIRFDFKDFFYSIRERDVIETLSENALLDSADDEMIINNCCFISRNHQKCLAIGSPSSPILSNAVMYHFDDYCHRIAVANGSEYTRYADDIVFSYDKKERHKTFFENLNTYLDKVVFPKLIINKNKTLYMSKKNKRKITGLVITSDGKVSIGRDKKKYIKSLIFRHLNSELNTEEINYLSGYLAYIQDVEPSFIDSLCLKYKSEVVNDLIKRPKLTR